MKKLLLIFLLLPVFCNAQLLPGIAASAKQVVYVEAFGTAVAFEAAGTQSSGTTSCTPAYPPVEEGNALMMIVGTKLRHALVATPSGWQRRNETQDMVESSGSDQGEIRQTVFFKESDGTETGTVTVSCPDCNSINAVIYSLSKDPRGKWELNITSGTDQTADATYLVTSKQNVRSKTGDVFLVVSSINTDAYAYTDEAVSQSGTTFSTVNAEVGEYPTTQGNDQEQIASVFSVSSALVTPAKLVYTATANGSAASNPKGTTHFIQARQSIKTQEVPPSNFKEWVATDIVDNTWSGDASPLWDGMRTSITSTGTVSGAGFDIVEHNGRVCFKYAAPLQDASNYWQRAEVYKPQPQQPMTPIGTQLIHEIRYETPSDAPTVYREFGVLQNHTGTAPGGPWPLNSPLYYFGFAYAGQTGWTNTGSAATGGEFIVVHKTAGERYLIPGTVWGQSKTITIRHMVCHDYASGTPALKVWLKVDDGDFELVYENYTDKTVWETADIETDGAITDGGGAIKTGIYNHMITSGTIAGNSIAAGNSGYTLFAPGEKLTVLLPSDVDYITDVTDNANPIYEKVSTANY